MASKLGRLAYFFMKQLYVRVHIRKKNEGVVTYIRKMLLVAPEMLIDFLQAGSMKRKR